MYSLISRGSQSRSCEFLDGVVKLLSGCQKIQGDIRTDSPKGVTMSSIFPQYHERQKDRLFKRFDQGCDFSEKDKWASVSLVKRQCLTNGQTVNTGLNHSGRKMVILIVNIIIIIAIIIVIIINNAS